MNFSPKQETVDAKGELHLMVLWHNARTDEKRIVNDLANELRILAAYEVKWDPDKVMENFKRFYGVKLPQAQGKIAECGIGPALLLLVWDAVPTYSWMDTGRGTEWVNTKMFSLKCRYRSWTRGGHKIHATNSPDETNHDLTLLIGKNAQDWLAAAPNAWDGVIKEWKHDIIGAWGWDSYEQLFYVLNNTSSYVLMRGEECIEGRCSKEHGDIDILTDNYDNLVLLVNGEPALNSIRPHFLTKVGTATPYFDLWDASMKYEDPKWSVSIFERKRILSGIYVMDSENAFYHLLYHIFFHKPEISPDYVVKISSMAQELGIEWTEWELRDNMMPTDKYFHRLMSYLRDNGYAIEKPLDPTVRFNEDTACTDRVCRRLEELFHMDEVRPVMLNAKRTSGYRYYVGYGQGKKYFIKWGGLGESARNEYVYTKRLHEMYPQKVIKPYFCRHASNENVFVAEYFVGQSLDELMKSGKMSDSTREALITQIHEMAVALRKCRLVHRDIRPANICFSLENNNIVLMDNQFMVDADNYQEMPVVRYCPHWFERLGADYAFGRWQWDDMYSFSKLMREIAADGVSDSAIQLIREVESWIGEMRITLVPPKRPLTIRRVIRKFVRIVSKSLRRIENLCLRIGDGLDEC